jgi:sulfoxide reductase heme-binding subunit YedZ
VPRYVGRIGLWLLLVAPLAWQGSRYTEGSVYYGEFLSWTGVQSARLLLVTLALTPLRRWRPRSGWIGWFARHRRDLGLVTFVYASAHLAVYLQYKADAARILDESLSAGLGTGWIAYAVFAILAATSNDRSVRTLGRRWRTLHRGVYAAAVLTFAHWILTAFDPLAGAVHAAVLGVLLLLRFVVPKRGG